MNAERKPEQLIPSALLGNAERSPRSASPSVRCVQRVATAGAGTVEILAARSGSTVPSNLSKPNVKRKCLEFIVMWSGMPTDFVTAVLNEEMHHA
jgi:hypothetical protein